jgi:hypothetical protein
VVWSRPPLYEYLDHRTSPSSGFQQTDQPGLGEIPDALAHVPTLETAFVAELPVYAHNELRVL